MLCTQFGTHYSQSQPASTPCSVALLGVCSAVTHSLALLLCVVLLSVCSAHRITAGGKRVTKTTFSASSVADLEAAGVDVALAAAFSASRAAIHRRNDSGGAGDFRFDSLDGFTLQAQEAAFSQADSAVVEQSEWTVGGLPAVNFYAWVPSIPGHLSHTPSP